MRIRRPRRRVGWFSPKTLKRGGGGGGGGWGVGAQLFHGGPRHPRDVNASTIGGSAQGVGAPLASHMLARPRTARRESPLQSRLVVVFEGQVLVKAHLRTDSFSQVGRTVQSFVECRGRLGTKVDNEKVADDECFDSNSGRSMNLATLFAGQTLAVKGASAIFNLALHDLKKPRVSEGRSPPLTPPSPSSNCNANAMRKIHML